MVKRDKEGHYMIERSIHQGYDGGVVNIYAPNIRAPKYIKLILGFPGGAVVENLPANAGDTGSSPGLGISHMPRSN